MPDLSELRRTRPWFRSKRYGYGWGLPARWEGWAVVAVWAVLVFGAPALLGADVGAVVALGATAVLLGITWCTGAPLRWRWGGDEPPTGPFVRGGVTTRPTSRPSRRSSTGGPSAGAAVADPDFAYLTTTGRRTGEPHAVELWYRLDGSTVWFLAGIDPPIVGGRPDWVRNLEVDPNVLVRVGDGPDVAATGAVEECGEALRHAFDVRYRGVAEGAPLSRWAATGLSVAVRPVTGV